MIQMIDFLVIVFNCLIVFLSLCESLLPTIIQREYRSSVGVFPLKIVPSGFHWFKIKTVRLHHRRVVDSAVNFFKLKKKFQVQIWDPGVSNSRFEDGEIKLQTDFINTSRLVESRTASMTGKKMAGRACDSCIKRLHASWYCPADDIFLYQNCDVSIYMQSTYLLARRHKCVRLHISLSLEFMMTDKTTLVCYEGFMSKARTARNTFVAD